VTTQHNIAEDRSLRANTMTISVSLQFCKFSFLKAWKHITSLFHLCVSHYPPLKIMLFAKIKDI